MEVKPPPARISPSAWTATDCTVPFALGSNNPVCHSWIHSRYVAARLPTDGREEAAQHDFSVGLDSNRQNIAIHIRIPAIRQTGRRIQPGGAI